MADDDNDNHVSYWNQHPRSMSTPRLKPAAVAVDEYRVLITGGVNHSSAEMFDCRDPPPTTPITVPNMKNTRFDHASLCCENYVYVIGGYFQSFVGGGADGSVERININDLTTATAEWETVPSMNQARDGCATALHNETIYVFGGKDDKEILTAELYNTTKPNEGWKKIPKTMKQQRMDHCAVTVGDEIFIMGGKAKDDYGGEILGSVVIYNIINESFRDGPTMPMPLAYMSAVVRGTYIVLCGGVSTHDDERLTSTLLLDTKSMEWSVIDDHLLRISRKFHASFLFNDNIYVFGGLGTKSIEFTPFIEMSPPRRV
jgi:N-acetylneuraminic acid mutarotase